MKRTVKPSVSKRVGITQRDIAEIARVSQATVSRVLTGGDGVEQETADRVRAILRQHNYQPDAMGRSLRAQKSGLIGLVVKRNDGDLKEDPFFAQLASKIIDTLSGTPYTLCVEVTNESHEGAVYDELLRSRRVDGLILVESEPQDERIRLLQRDCFPFVLIGNPVSGGRKYPKSDAIWSVDNDNVTAAREATEHLIEVGYRRIGFLAGPREITVSRDRVAGYEAALTGMGAEPRVWGCGFGLESSRQAGEAILSGPNRPDALLVLDDFMAMGVTLAARQLDLRVPQDLGLVSFNDSRLCDIIDCGLTSVNLNIGDLVSQACKRLLSLTEGTADSQTVPHRTLVPTSLTVRGSSRLDAEVNRAQAVVYA